MWWQANLMRDELSRWLLRYVAFPIISILSSSISVTSCHFLSRDKANGIQQNKPRLNSTVVLVWRKKQMNRPIKLFKLINQFIYHRAYYKWHCCVISLTGTSRLSLRALKVIQNNEHEFRMQKLILNSSQKSQVGTWNNIVNYKWAYKIAHAYQS